MFSGLDRVSPWTPFEVGGIEDAPSEGSGVDSKRCCAAGLLRRVLGRDAGRLDEKWVTASEEGRVPT